MEFLFHFSAISVLPFWLPMIFLPRWSVTHKLIASPWIILPPVLCYTLLALPNAGDLLGVFAGTPSPDGLAAVMGEPWAASMFWAYAGAFDLFVGRWMFLDARERKIHPLFVSPALAVAIFFGPIGFSMYAAVRAGHALAGRGEAPPAEAASA